MLEGQRQLRVGRAQEAHGPGRTFYTQDRCMMYTAPPTRKWRA
jgi:hypothetical protein